MTVRTARPLSRARAASCALINLAATPGLGSLMARRFFSGIGQLLLALGGSVLIVSWVFELCYRVFLQQLGNPVPPDSSGWLWKWGLLLFGAGWLWSLATSLSLLWQARADGPVEPKPIPPRLADLPGQPPRQS